MRNYRRYIHHRGSTSEERNRFQMALVLEARLNVWGDRAGKVSAIEIGN